VKWNENGDAYEPPISYVRIRKTSIISPLAPRPFSTALRTAIGEKVVRGKIRS